MRVITPRTADSPAIGTGSLTCGFLHTSMAHQNHNPIPCTGESSHNQHNCNGRSNSFCNVCGEYNLKKNLQRFNDDLRETYEECFKCRVIDDKQDWLPQLICNKCRAMFTRYRKNRTPIKFIKPVIWSEPKSKEDCYFCMTNTRGFNSSNIHKIVYASVSSVTKPFMVPTKESNDDQESDISSLLSELEIDETSEVESKVADESDDEFLPAGQQEKKKGCFDQKELNDLVRGAGAI